MFGLTLLSFMARLAFVLALALAVGACGPDASAPAAAQKTYGAAVDASEAVPSVAVAAEAEAYTGRPLTVEGRVAAVSADGCTLQLATEEGPPLLVTAPQAESDECAWQVPAGEDGIAVAAGTLRAADDTLRIAANGVQVTPVRFADSDS